MDRVRQTIRVALFAATLVAVLDVSYGDSRLPLTCKNIARDAIINSCKGPRSKRSVQEQRPLVRTLTVDGLDSSAEPVTTQQKRQWRTEILPSGMLGPIGPMGSLGPIGPMGAMGPYSMGATDNTYHNVGFSSPTMQYQNDEGSSMTSQMIGPSTSFAPFPGRYRYSL